LGSSSWVDDRQRQPNDHLYRWGAQRSDSFDQRVHNPIDLCEYDAHAETAGFLRLSRHLVTGMKKIRMSGPAARRRRTSKGNVLVESALIFLMFFSMLI